MNLTGHAKGLEFVEMKKLMLTQPSIQGENIKVWSIKKNETIRINLVEFNGKLGLHKHPDADHSLMVLEGKVMAEVSGKTFYLSKGDFISIPKDAPHRYESLSQKSVFVSMDAPYYDPKKTVRLK